MRDINDTVDNINGGSMNYEEVRNTAEQPRVTPDMYGGNTQYSNGPRPNQYSAAIPGYGYNDVNQPVSVARWLGRMFLLWIPFVGGLVYFIMVIIWACSDKFERTSKNWAVASLIMCAINILVGILMVCGFLALFSSIANDPTFQNELNNFINSVPSATY